MTVSTDYGVTASGFVPKTYTVIKSEWEARVRGKFGAGFNLDAETPEGQLIGIAADRETILWQQLEAIYHATGNPGGAGGASLDNLGLITGAVRLGASKSTAAVTCTGTPGTVLDAGRAVSVTGVGSRFTTTAAATVAALTTWAGATAYAVGDVRTNDGKAYRCEVAGTSAASGGPTGTDREALIVDGAGALRWRYLGGGTGAVDVAAESEDYGAVSAPARSLTVIETPVSGWLGAVNTLDAALGSLEQTDPAYRIRREKLLHSQGYAAVDAVRAAVMRVSGVTSCTVYENTLDETDGDGRTPHSMEVLVEGGLDADIAAAVWASKPGGTELCGTTSASVTDASGTVRTVKFSRRVETPIYVVVRRAKDVRTYPTDGDDQIKLAVVAWADANHGIGDDVVSSAFIPSVFGISGVTDVPLPYIGTAPSPATAATIAIDNRHRATFDTSRVIVEDL